ncbi:MAG TPA: hypothetical protein VGU71_16620 [Candidatus Dormibacteraeota bacterium]|nr:hypothetical protein [Candidatus Dormibacteraeota bacterium]
MLRLGRNDDRRSKFRSQQQPLVSANLPRITEVVLFVTAKFVGLREVVMAEQVKFVGIPCDRYPQDQTWWTRRRCRRRGESGHLIRDVYLKIRKVRARKILFRIWNSGLEPCWMLQLQRLEHKHAVQSNVLYAPHRRRT